MNKGLLHFTVLCCLLSPPTTVLASEINDLKKRISDLEAAVEKSDKKTKKKLKSLKSDLKEEQDKLRISGFATVGFTKADVNFSTSDRDFTNEYNFSSDTKAAVQLDYKITEQWSATIQFMGRAFNEWDTKNEWAFIKYAPSEQLAFRAGRLRLPFYYYSESLDVGLVYPWVRPPMPFYVTSIANYEGMDVNYRFATGNLTHEATLFAGATKGTLPSGLTLNLTDLWGGTYQINYNALSARVMGMTVDADATTGLGLLEDRVGYYSMALQYNDGKLFAMLEAARSETDLYLVRTSDAGHFTVGYQFGQWKPFAAYSMNKSLDNENVKVLIPPTNAPLLPETKVESTSFGVVFDINTQINAKFQYDHFYGLGDGNPNFQGLKDGTDLYSVNLNAVF